MNETLFYRNYFSTYSWCYCDRNILGAQWLSWWIVFILAVLCFIPLTSFLVRCVGEYACCDFRDFVWAFKQEINPISESKKESENNNRFM